VKIFITGGSGFIGTHLSNFFLEKGHQVTGVGFRADSGRIRHSNYSYIQADTTREGSWQASLEKMDAVVNLAGRTIFKRWTGKYKTEIYDSRILTTRNLVNALPADNQITLCSASAVGYYGGDHGDEIMTEASGPGKDFLARVSVDWEAGALAAEGKGTRVVLTRFGVVLDKGGGALKQMLPVFRSFGGGPIGSGRQWFPWIHMADLSAAFEAVFENRDISGPVNFCAPNPVQNRDFAKALGRVLNRPAFLPVPQFMLRLATGEFSEILLGGQRVLPEKLQAHDFRFQFPDVQGALADLTRALPKTAN
jgi:uncharacterized protein